MELWHNQPQSWKEAPLCPRCLFPDPVPRSRTRTRRSVSAAAKASRRNVAAESNNEQGVLSEPLCQGYRRDPQVALVLGFSCSGREE